MTEQQQKSKIELIKNLLEAHQGHKEINKKEFKEIFSKLKISDNQLEEIFKQIDKKNDNKLEHSEIISFFNSQEKKLRELFDSIDQDKNGKISLSELKFALESNHLSNNETMKNQTPSNTINDYNNNRENLARNLMNVYDKNHDGFIDFEEWKDALLFIPNVSLNYAVNWSLNTTASLSFLMENTVPMQLAHESTQNLASSFKPRYIYNFLSGGLAAAIARTLTAPLDRLKILYQLNYKENSTPPSITKGLKQIVEAEGFRGLFRGNLVNILKASPDSSIKLGVFELLKKKLKRPGESEISKKMLFVAGSISGFLSCLCVYPLDVIKTRIAGSPKGTYKGIQDVISKIWVLEGGIRPFFKGFSAAFTSSLLNSGMNLSFYDLLRRAAFKLIKKENLPIPVFMGIGAISASATTTFLYPFNLISARMIMQGMNKIEKVKLNVFEMVLNVYSREGLLGFYKGYAPTTTKIFIGNGISFGAYEFCRKIFFTVN